LVKHSDFEGRIREILMDFKDGYFGYESTVKRIMDVIAQAEDEAYREGYDKGFTHGEDIGYWEAEEDGTDAYFSGYNEALDMLERNIKYDSTIPHNVKEKIYDHIDYVRNKK